MGETNIKLYLFFDQTRIIRAHFPYEL